MYYGALGYDIGDIKKKVAELAAAELKILRVPGAGQKCPPIVPKHHPKTGWWFRASRTMPGGGECMLPTETRVVKDHRGTAETGTMRVITQSRSGTSSATVKDPIVAECEKAGLPGTECYKLRAQERMSLEEAGAHLVATQTAAVEEAQAAAKAATMKKYLLIGGVAAAGVLAVYFLRKPGK